MSDIIREIEKLHFDIDLNQMQQYENAIDEFNSLIEKGLVTNRGYNIKTIEQSYSYYSYNDTKLCR